MSAPRDDAQLALVGAGMAPIRVHLERAALAGDAEAHHGRDRCHMVRGDAQLRVAHEGRVGEDPADHRQGVDRHVEHAQPVGLPDPVLVGVEGAEILVPVDTQRVRRLVGEEPAGRLHGGVVLRVPGGE
ncbi:MAG: hypothetical protein ACK55I_17055, partial [bacterium]